MGTGFEDLAGDAAVHALRVADYSYFMARVAFSNGDLGSAKQELQRALSLQRTVPRVRGEQSVLALELQLCSRLDGKFSPGKLKRLRSLHLKSRECGTRDFEAGSLFRSLAIIGETSEARSLLNQYLRIRRTRTKPHSALEEACADLGVRQLG